MNTWSQDRESHDRWGPKIGFGIQNDTFLSSVVSVSDLETVSNGVWSLSVPVLIS